MKKATKNILVVVNFVLFFTVYLCSATTVECSWWEKGVDALQSLSSKKSPTDLTVGEIAGAFKDALQIGSDKVVGQLGRFDGFNNDKSVRIALPGELQNVKTMFSKVGMSHLFDDLEVRLNRAAENAVPKAKALFLQSIRDMRFEDVKAIYEGPEDAATHYFQKKMSPALLQEMSPIIDQSLSQVGAIAAYDKIMGQYKALPFVPDVKADLTNHVANKAMDGMFHYIALEEAAIRRNPALQTTELLKRVFGRK
ncbi:MAG: DUF4197 domain-containing protein [Desulfobulbaceae bacterium]|nr:DUF4197 domain-containing protein [Desulfobulbaceae bacterium]